MKSARRRRYSALCPQVPLDVAMSSAILDRPRPPCCWSPVAGTHGPMSCPEGPPPMSPHGQAYLVCRDAMRSLARTSCYTLELFQISQGGISPLDMASYYGHEEICELLLDNGADLQYSLHWAAFGGHKELVKMLMEKGAPRDAINRQGHSPYYLALSQGHLSCLQVLSESPSEVLGVVGSEGLELACYKGHLPLVRWLVGGADLDILLDINWLHILSLATRGEGNRKLRHGPDITVAWVVVDSQRNASAFVIKTGSTTQWQATDLTPKEMATSDMRNRRHVQPHLTWSTNAAHPPVDHQLWCDSNHTGVLQTVLKAHPNPEQLQWPLQLTLLLALQWGCVNSAKILVPHLGLQAFKNASAFVIKTGSTTQWQATDSAPEERATSDMRNRHHPGQLSPGFLVSLLLLPLLLFHPGLGPARAEFGRTVNGGNMVSSTSTFHLAPMAPDSCKSSTPPANTTDLALKEMAASDMRNRRHVQPLGTWSTNTAHPVSLEGNEELMWNLLQHQADPTTVNLKGNTPLHLAAAKGNVAVADKLISKGADLEAKNNLGQTPIHLACSSGSCEIFQLLEKSACLTVLDNLGCSTLHYAARREEEYVLKQIVKKHPKLAKIQDQNGKFPIQVAVDHGNLDAIRILTSVYKHHKNASAFVIKTGSTTQWQADLAPKEMAVSDMRNRRHVQPLLTWSTNAAHPVTCSPETIFSILCSNKTADLSNFISMADLTRTFQHNLSLLHVAVLKGNLEAVKLLLLREPEMVTMTCLNNWTPAHLAVLNKKNDILECLLNQRSALLQPWTAGNAEDKQGRTLLHLALEERLWSQVECLAENGGRLTITDPYFLASFCSSTSGLAPTDCPRRIQAVWDFLRKTSTNKRIGIEMAAICYLCVDNLDVPQATDPYSKNSWLCAPVNGKPGRLQRSQGTVKGHIPVLPIEIQDFADERMAISSSSRPVPQIRESADNVEIPLLATSVVTSSLTLRDLNFWKLTRRFCIFIMEWRQMLSKLSSWRAIDRYWQILGQTGFL
ncbi:hypothetical protein LAZ67_8002285 [Cordylochernes scorpioides]|uniref:Alpha-latrotoxin n=1 Tax=Cordylochernes scorpioides TaxID=51811 RepID=A0ABY6KUH5_9ARAC|nr:hypothetical protein LAZ67_8002285 [Cordylochernes scorpioides]